MCCDFWHVRHATIFALPGIGNVVDVAWVRSVSWSNSERWAPASNVRYDMWYACIDSFSLNLPCLFNSPLLILSDIMAFFWFNLMAGISFKNNPLCIWKCKSEKKNMFGQQSGLCVVCHYFLLLLFLYFLPARAMWSSINRSPMTRARWWEYFNL